MTVCEHLKEYTALRTASLVNCQGNVCDSLIGHTISLEMSANGLPATVWTYLKAVRLSLSPGQLVHGGVTVEHAIALMRIQKV